MEFFDRIKELAALNREYQQRHANFLVLYGRRRVGKTRLLKEFIQDKPHIYFLVDKQLEIDLRRRFQQSIGYFLKDEVLGKIEFNDWDGLFRYWLDRTDFSKKVVLVIDEFQYLVKVNPAFPSILQRWWDEEFQTKNVFLILCGSLMNMMYSSTLSYQSPLYGRRTGQIRLEPISFPDFQEFFPDLTFQQLVEFYSVIGGVPKYMEFVNLQHSIFENIRTIILDRNAYLYHEPRFILSEELTEIMTYFSILRTIAEGEHKIGNIAAKLHLPTNRLTKYLELLIDLGLLERQVPVTEEQPQKSKKGLYFIRDYFFRFWFHYVFPFQSLLEMDHTDFVLEKIRADFSHFVAPVFEAISQALVGHWNATDQLPFKPERWGRWWSRQQEIDVVALNASSREILFGECKWTQQPVGPEVLLHLKQQAQSVKWYLNERTEYFLIISKSGFTPDLKRLAARGEVLLARDFGLLK